MVKLTDFLQNAANLIIGAIPVSKPSVEKLSHTKLVAHRGCWNQTNRLENTLAAFDHCLNKNIWAIEFDIRFTKDDVPIVHHDASLKRVFNLDKNVADLTLDELHLLCPHIPSLKDVLTRYKSQLHFMIELKVTASKTQAQNLKEDLKDLTPIQDFHLMSLEFTHFSPLLQNFPKKSFVSIGRTDLHKIFRQSLKENIGAVTGQYLLLTNTMKRECHKQGLKVGTGFPNSKNLLFREINRDMDWVFTNEAEKLSTYMKK